MGEAIRPSLYTIPYGTSLCDVVAGRLLDEFGGDPVALGKVTVFVPNNRAIGAMTQSFVRVMKGGLLLPKIIAIGDLDLGESYSPSLDPVEGTANIPPAISHLRRQMILTRLILKQREGSGEKIHANEALRLAGQLAKVIDELEIAEIDYRQLATLELKDELASHWQRAFGRMVALIPAYFAELDRLQLVGQARRRNMLLDHLAARLHKSSTGGRIVAAGISTSAPAIARLLRRIALMPGGEIIFPALDLHMDGDEWAALGPHEVEEGMLPPPAHEGHPQYHLKNLLEKMGFGRDEIMFLPEGEQARIGPVTRLFCLPLATSAWRGLPDKEKEMPNIRLMVAEDMAEEARAIAITLRQMVERPGFRSALVTPDRELAGRVAAQLKRWGILVDDSAGKPLVQSAGGVLLMALARAMSERFSAISLLAIAKHPLVKKGEGRLAWLEQVRELDMSLRGPQLGIGLDAVGRQIRGELDISFLRLPETGAGLDGFWQEYANLLAPLDLGERPEFRLLLDRLVSVATELTGGEIWKGTDGRQLSQFIEELAGSDLAAIGPVERSTIPAVLEELLDGQVTRPQYGSHPRVAIYGLLEARFQQADLVICGGLNEGTWPQVSAPDPWLAPRIRRQLGLASLDYHIGLSAHDLASLIGRPDIILSRSRYAAGSPQVASRFVMRTQAMLGDRLRLEQDMVDHARTIDLPDQPVRISAPNMMPSPEQRRVGLSITDFRKLLSDPYSFYARKILRLQVLRPVGGVMDAAFRGSLVHMILQRWFEEDECDPDRLLSRAEAIFANPAFDPAMRTLWRPRIAGALSFIAGQTAYNLVEYGRKAVAAELSGQMMIKNINIRGRADRVDRFPDGSLAIIDYKTGQAPRGAVIQDGFDLQLGLLGMMALQGGFERPDIAGTSGHFEYWSMSRDPGKDSFGQVRQYGPDMTGRGNGIDLVALAEERANFAIDEWILGDAPFTPLLFPQFAEGGDYEQLMRLQEWDGCIAENGATENDS